MSDTVNPDVNESSGDSGPTAKPEAGEKLAAGSENLDGSTPRRKVGRPRKPGKRVAFTINVQPETRRRIKVAAAMRDMTPAELVDELAAKHIRLPGEEDSEPDGKEQS